MKLHDVKEHLQNHLSDGLVVIVGSGLSCAEGVPGMGVLAQYLIDEVPKSIRDNDRVSWSKVSDSLGAGEDLENVFLKVKLSETLEEVILESTHAYILIHEAKVIKEVSCEGRVLRFTKLLSHLLKPNSGLPVITTNYDRLIEIASEAAGLAVNNLSTGKYFGSFDPRESRFSMCRNIRRMGKSAHLEYTNHVTVFKPHGSVDWFLVNNEPIFSSIISGGRKLMITPGANKFRGGYDRPFDLHRELANREIDNASRYLIIGYGFNDDHLQVHLDQQLSNGKSAVILTHSITEKTRKYVGVRENIWTVVSRDGVSGFKLIIGKEEFEFNDIDIWDLEKFVEEVLE
ncbi:MAG: SIR2 family protein [Gammaproteobacteria bacterium]|nr:MAG: SIR2 family protein [Gammaproteobacteria bacterium]